MIISVLKEAWQRLQKKRLIPEQEEEPLSYQHEKEAQPMPTISPDEIYPGLERNHEEWLKHIESPIKVIGIGGGASNVIDAMLCSPFDKAEYVVINMAAYRLHSYKVLTPVNYLELINPFGVRHGLISLREFIIYYGNEANELRINRVIDDTAKKLILVIGLGGQESIYVIEWLLQLIEEKHITTTVIATLPFQFEGEKRRNKALKQLLRIKEYRVSVITVEAEDIMKSNLYTTFSTVFNQLDEFLAKLVSDVCNDIDANVVVDKSFQIN